MTPTTPLDEMEQLAQRYADELSAQFRTLNLFVQHAGEIGRAHETFLRGVFERFLPGKLRCGTGFVASEDGVTTQQDIIIYERFELPILLEVGDCIVVDREAVVGTIEVKTTLDTTARFTEAIRKIGRLRGVGFRGLYAWEGISEAEALGCLWERYRSLERLDMSDLPDAIYVREKYLILRNDDGCLDTAPLLIMRLGSRGMEGRALLSFITRLWLCGAQSVARWPWWALSSLNRGPDQFEHLPWPNDLAVRVQEHLRTRKT